jgi:hypothetical protein
MIQKLEYLSSKGHVFFIVSIPYQVLFGKAPEPFNKIEIRSIRRQRLNMVAQGALLTIG